MGTNAIVNECPNEKWSFTMLLQVSSQVNATCFHYYYHYHTMFPTKFNNAMDFHPSVARSFG